MFTVVTLLLPLLALGAVEGVLRIACSTCALPLFVPAPFAASTHEVANRRVSERWFGERVSPPAPMLEPFAAVKSPAVFRVFVLGESSAAGFPYPRNGAFSRLLGDLLREAIPDRAIEVVNLGIAATNSFAMLDMSREVASRRPDLVIIYGGHNEYYGVLGVGWRERTSGLSVRGVRTMLALQRLHLVQVARRALSRRGSGWSPSGPEDESASLMELLGHEQFFPYGGTAYLEGVRQYEANLEGLVRRFRARGIPVFVGSLASNLRDQRPFVAAGNAGEGGANAAFEGAHARLAIGDTMGARALFLRARDLDVVRFRAPTAFNQVISEVGRREGAVYVPVAEAFEAASPGGIPGGNLFLEHVHPNREGYALIARSFFRAVSAAGLVGEGSTGASLPEASELARRVPLTALDERIAWHSLRTIESRWPFVPVHEQRDHRRSYEPSDLLDTLAFEVSGGLPWERGKLRMAVEYERRGEYDSAAAEYAGLARDAPLFDEPLRLWASALVAAGRHAEAEAALSRAVRLRPAADAYAELAALSIRRGDLEGGIARFQRSLEIQPQQPDVLYRLSLAYAMANQPARAREAARMAVRLAPRHPLVSEWARELGVSP